MYGISTNPQLVIRHGYSNLPRHMSQRPTAPIHSVDGILIEEPYVPEKGDPIVVEEAEFRGEVVQMGKNHREVVRED